MKCIICRMKPVVHYETRCSQCKKEHVERAKVILEKSIDSKKNKDFENQLMLSIVEGLCANPNIMVENIPYHTIKIHHEILQNIEEMKHEKTK